MAVPQRRISKTRKRLRRTHFKINAKGLVVCKHCGEMIQPHVVCSHCGYYDGKPVNAKKEAKPVDATNSKKAKKSKEKKEESK